MSRSDTVSIAGLKILPGSDKSSLSRFLILSSTYALKPRFARIILRVFPRAPFLQPVDKFMSIIHFNLLKHKAPAR